MILKIGGKPYELATKEEVMKEVFDKLYPVGSVYISLDGSFNPNNTYNGKWELIEQGRYLRATTNINNVGQNVNAGLPDITGSINGRTGYYWSAQGCLIKGAAANSASVLENKNDGSYQMSFKASASNSIYGKSNTVTPESIDAFIWKRVG